MARFKLVYVYPPTGFPDRLQNAGDTPTPLHDAYIRSSRAVTWLYTEALLDVEVYGDRSELRIFVRAQPAADDVCRVHVWPQRPHDLPGEFAFVELPSSAGTLGARDRARLLLEAVHAAVLRLAELRGWDPGLFQPCREHVLARDLVYRWSGPWKSSPDRRHRARSSYVLTPLDGWGRAVLEIATRDGDTVVARSGQAIAWSTQPGFERAAKSLRWTGTSEVGLQPYWEWNMPSGSISARLVGDAWTFSLTDEVTVRQPGGDGLDPQADGQPLPPVVVTADRL